MDEVLTGMAEFSLDLLWVVVPIFVILVVAGAIYQRNKRK